MKNRRTSREVVGHEAEGANLFPELCSLAPSAHSNRVVLPKGDSKFIGMVLKAVFPGHLAISRCRSS